MSAARITSDGKVAQLDARAGADEVVAEADVQDPAKLAKLLGRLLASVAALRRRFSPSRIDFEDVVVGAFASTVSLRHNFGGRVRWWCVSFQSAASSGPGFQESPTLTTPDTLVLFSFVAGTATLRVEASG